MTAPITDHAESYHGSLNDFLSYIRLDDRGWHFVFRHSQHASKEALDKDKPPSQDRPGHEQPRKAFEDLNNVAAAGLSSTSMQQEQQPAHTAQTSHTSRHQQRGPRGQRQQSQTASRPPPAPPPRPSSAASQAPHFFAPSAPSSGVNWPPSEHVNEVLASDARGQLEPRRLEGVPDDERDAIIEQVMAASEIERLWREVSVNAGAKVSSPVNSCAAHRAGR